MKKRLLSAALALAMVLTLLPMSVFAATTTGNSALTPQAAPDYTTGAGTANEKTDNKFYDVSSTKNITQTVTRFDGRSESYGRKVGSWYWLDNKTDPQNPVYYEVTTGIITGNNGSGSWYASVNDFYTTNSANVNSLRSTTFTVLNMAVNLNSISGGIGTATSTVSLNVDLVGSSAVLTVPSNLASLTVTSKFEGSPVGTVSGLTFARGTYATTAPGNSAVTLNATNVIVGDISLTGRANNVTLTNCEAGSVTMDGEYESNATGAKTFSGQRFTATNSKVGAMEITGDSSTVSLTSVNGGDPGTAGGAVTVKGNGGTLTIAGASNVGAVVVNSRAAATTDTTIDRIPTVTVTGGKLASLKTTGEAGAKASSFTLSSTTGTTNVGAIETGNGSVTVNANVTTTTIAVPEGSLTLNGPLSTGVITLADNGPTTLSITNSSTTGIDIAGITATDGSKLTINSWPTGRHNDFGTVDLGTFAGRKIAGGTFAGAQAFNTAAKQAWVNTTNLLFQVNVDTAKTALYNKDELGKAIEDIGQTKAAGATPNIGIIGQGLTNVITLKYGSDTLATIGHTAATPMILPSRINSKNIVSWMLVGTGDSVVNSYISGKEYNLPATEMTLNATNVSEDVAKITGVTASLPDGTTAIRATLNGTTINLSGAVSAGVGGLTSITLDLTTDVVDTTGVPVVLSGVPVDFNNTTKAVSFNEFWVPTGGARIENGQLVLANGTRYTVTGSGLAVPTGLVKVAPEGTGGYGIQATLGGRLNSFKPEAKTPIINALSGTGTKFTVGDNAAMAEAINAALAKITNDSTATNWIKTAQTNVWRNGFKSPNTTKNNGDAGYAKSNGESLTPHSGTISSTDATGNEIMSAFSQVWLVPYLQVNVTDHDESGLLTATLVPSYRIDVSGSTTYDPDMAYTVQAGQTLGNLTGDMASDPVKVKFNLGNAFATQKMHQDGKYVYTGVGGEWTINHAGTTGLGLIQINGIDGLVELTNGQTGAKIASGKYDSLQAAVDDTIPETATETSTIKIVGGFEGSCAFTMTGAARTINIQALGNKDVTCSSNYVTRTQVDGENYTFQLMRDAAVVTGDVNIVVNTADNGSAAASVSKTAAGQTVTITTMPATGYMVNTVTARTNANANVTVTASGTNQYTFVVPANVTSVTVTPTFKVADTSASFVANNSSLGTATAITGTADGKAQQGSTVPVTVSPTTGYRTMGLTARGNNGATASVTRTGTNSFNVTVPVGATTVTLTPSFDINNGTPFIDVLASHWSSDFIAWAYKNGYTSGKDTSYTYKPTDYITRGEVVAMLWKADGAKKVNIVNPFKDVPANYWGYDAVMWAVSKGLVDTSTGYFQPTSYINRADTVAILYKNANSPTVYGTSGFVDVPNNAAYARAVTWARQKGLTNGYSGSTHFRPTFALTRQEMATFLYRAYAK